MGEVVLWREEFPLFLLDDCWHFKVKIIPPSVLKMLHFGFQIAGAASRHCPDHLEGAKSPTILILFETF
jgi:hypothetical protein